MTSAPVSAAAGASVPGRASRGVNRLWLATAISDFGDGMILAAGPLLMTTLTRDPITISSAAGVMLIPALVLGLPSGALVDRWNATRVMVGTDLIRGVLLGMFTAGLALGLLRGRTGIAAVYLLAFVVGFGDTFVEPAAQAVLPAIARRVELARMNSRIAATGTLGRSLIGPPLGALAFALTTAFPFGVDAASFLLAGLLMLRMPPATTSRGLGMTGLLGDAGDGMRWLLAQPSLRLLAFLNAVMNVTMIAVFSTLVIYAQRRLHASHVEYGLLTACTAIGAVLGTALATRLLRRFTVSRLLIAGLLVETLMHLCLALGRDLVVAAVVLVVFGVHAGVWVVVVTTTRQLLVPPEFRGRALAAYNTFGIGGSAVGGFVGGPLIALGNTTTPMWAALAVLGCVCAYGFPRLLRLEWPRA